MEESGYYKTYFYNIGIIIYITPECDYCNYDSGCMACVKKDGWNNNAH